MHYYGKNKIQTTKAQIAGIYEIEEIKWKYIKQILNPVLFPKGGIFNTLSMLLTGFLSGIGFGKHLRIGYTLVLKKVNLTG